MSEPAESFDDLGNPLDTIEDVLTGQDWIFNRPREDELSVHVSGRSGNYRLTFLWQEEYGALQFFCESDVCVPPARQDTAGRVLRTINERLWLGHFDVAADSAAPTFRHTSLLRGWTHGAGAEHIEDLVDIALAESERHYGVFNFLATALHVDEDALNLMLSDNAGEA